MVRKLKWNTLRTNERIVRFPFKGIEIQVVHGDLTRERTGAIVVPANGSFRPVLLPGSLQEAVHKISPEIFSEVAAKSDIEWQEARPKAKISDMHFPPGHSILTTAGSLPAQNVIHTVGFSSKRDALDATDGPIIRKAIFGAIAKANEYGLSSMSIPVFGTGVLNKDLAVFFARGGMPDSLRDSVHASLSALGDHAQNTSLKKLRIVVLTNQEHERVVREVRRWLFNQKYIGPYDPNRGMHTLDEKTGYVIEHRRGQKRIIKDWLKQP